VFKRRDKQPLSQVAKEFFYPRGGIVRATRYVLHRMRRLPDSPHRVARGVFAGSLVGFLPLPGLQFLAAWGAARAVRGNVLAALLGTFNTNPLTTPFFAVMAMSLGHWIMGVDKPLTGQYIVHALENAGWELWYNFLAIFSSREVRWEGLVQFWHEIYVPYFIGALIPGIILSAIAYYLTIPLVSAYQKARAAKAHERAEKRGKLRKALAEATERLKRKTERPDAEGPGEP
jgi:uncharacterized protein